jgi:hypothetical protein
VLVCDVVFSASASYALSQKQPSRVPAAVLRAQLLPSCELAIFATATAVRPAICLFR